MVRGQYNIWHIHLVEKNRIPDLKCDTIRKQDLICKKSLRAKDYPHFPKKDAQNAPTNSDIILQDLSMMTNLTID